MIGGPLPARLAEIEAALPPARLAEIETALSEASRTSVLSKFLALLGPLERLKKRVASAEKEFFGREKPGPLRTRVDGMLGPSEERCLLLQLVMRNHFSISHSRTTRVLGCVFQEARRAHGGNRAIYLGGLFRSTRALTFVLLGLLMRSRFWFGSVSTRVCRPDKIFLKLIFRVSYELKWKWPQKHENGALLALK